jgi:hypothetical protein
MRQDQPQPIGEYTRPAKSAGYIRPMEFIDATNLSDNDICDECVAERATTMTADYFQDDAGNRRVVPSVGDAKSLAKQNHLRRCVILFETDEGQVGYSSYGKTKALCASTREVMDEIFDDLNHRIQWDSERLGANT